MQDGFEKVFGIFLKMNPKNIPIWFYENFPYLDIVLLHSNLTTFPLNMRKYLFAS